MKPKSESKPSIPARAKTVEENGGLKNTVAMEFFDKGFSSCTPEQKEVVNARIGQLGLCPQCGEKPTHQTPDGTLWDSNAHYWRKLC